MKTLLLIFLMLWIWHPTYAQDSLRLTNGSIHEVKVIYISHVVVKFHMWGDTTQTLYQVPKNEVVSIHSVPRHPDSSEKSPKKWAFVLTLGFPVSGIKAEMEEVFVRNEFSDTYINHHLFWKDELELYPKSFVRPAFLVDVEYAHKPNQSIGLSTSVPLSGSVKGYSTIFGHMYLAYGDMVVSPYYSLYSPSHLFQLRAGPSLHFSQISIGDNWLNSRRINQSVIRPGVYLSAALTATENKNSFVRLVAEYRFQIGSINFGLYDGAYPLDSPKNASPFPLTEQVKLSYGTIGIRYGMKL